MRQRELAAKSGIAPGYIGELETSLDINPTLHTIASLADALGVSPAYLLGVDPLTVMPRAAGVGSLVIDTFADSKHVLCPVQTGKSDCCGTCGLCWTMNRPVEFVRH